jgi:hypothetical protein
MFFRKLRFLLRWRSETTDSAAFRRAEPEIKEGCEFPVASQSRSLPQVVHSEPCTSQQLSCRGRSVFLWLTLV